MQFKVRALCSVQSSAISIQSSFLSTQCAVRRVQWLAALGRTELLLICHCTPTALHTAHLLSSLLIVYSLLHCTLLITCKCCRLVTLCWSKINSIFLVYLCAGCSTCIVCRVLWGNALSNTCLQFTVLKWHRRMFTVVFWLLVFINISRLAGLANKIKRFEWHPIYLLAVTKQNALSTTTSGNKDCFSETPCIYLTTEIKFYIFMYLVYCVSGFVCKSLQTVL